MSKHHIKEQANLNLLKVFWDLLLREGKVGGERVEKSLREVWMCYFLNITIWEQWKKTGWQTQFIVHIGNKSYKEPEIYHESNSGICINISTWTKIWIS